MYLFVSTLVLTSHFFDSGEERGGSDAEEFCCPACALDFPVGVLQGSFDIRFFAQVYILFGQVITGGGPWFLNWKFE